MKWLLFGLVVGALTLVYSNPFLLGLVYSNSVSFEFGSVSTLIIHLLGWIGVLLAVFDVCGSRVVERDSLYHSLVGIGVVTTTFQLFIA